MDLFRMLMTGSMLPSPAWAGDVFVWGPRMCNTACFELKVRYAIVCCQMAKWFSCNVRIRFEVVNRGAGTSKMQFAVSWRFTHVFWLFSIKACWPTMFIWLGSTKVKWWNDEILNPLQPMSADARASVWRRRQRRRLERRCLGMADSC